LAEGQEKLDAGKAYLSILVKEKEECDAKCLQLQTDADLCLKKKKETEDELKMNKLRLVRANKLLGGLADEKSRWIDEVKRFKHETG